MNQFKAASAVVTPPLSSFCEEPAPESSVRPLSADGRFAGELSAKLGPGGLANAVADADARRHAEADVLHSQGPRSVAALAAALSLPGRRWTSLDVTRVAVQYAHKGYRLPECPPEDAFVLLRGLVATLEPLAIAHMNAGARPPARARARSSVKTKVSDAFFYAIPAAGLGPARKRMLRAEIAAARRVAKRLTGKAEVVIL